MTRPIIIAHRGGAGLAPENTLEAFRMALDLGVDGVELDLQLNSAGELVVAHDILAEGDLGAGTPRLEAVLDLVWSRRPQTTVVIDLKATPWNPGRGHQGPRLVERLAPLVRQYPASERIVLGSFDWDALDHAAKVLPASRRAYHTMAARWLEFITPAESGVTDRRDLLAYLEDWRQRRWPGVEGRSLLDLLSETGAAIWSCLHRDLTEIAVTKARALDLAVWAWTVNTEPDLVRALGLGVDAITSDLPDKIMRHLDTQQWDIPK